MENNPNFLCHPLFGPVIQNLYHNTCKVRQLILTCLTWVNIYMIAQWKMHAGLFTRKMMGSPSWQCVGFQSNRVMHLLWNVFVGYAFQPIEKFMAILFNLLKRFWLWFSTCWKHSGYGFQPVEKILAMLFNLLKNLWLCFSTCWKKSGYAFQLLKSYILWISGIWKV